MILNKIWKTIASILAIFLGVFAVFQSGKKSGKKDIQLETAQEEIKKDEKISKIENNINSFSDNDIRERMREFTKDN